MGLEDILKEARKAAEKQGKKTEESPPVEPRPDRTLGQRVVGAVMPYARPAMEVGGMLGGGALGAAAGLAGGPASPATVPLMGLAGAAGGTAIAKQGADFLEQYAGTQQAPQSLMEAATKTGENIYGGVKDALYGEAGGAALPYALKAGGKVMEKVGYPIMGRLSGRGAATAETAYESSKTFNDAMRGKITGREVVENFKDSLETVKHNMATDYASDFEQIKNMPVEINMGSIQNKLRQLMKNYRVKVTPKGEIDLSGMALGKKSREQVKDVIEDVWNWTDKSPAGIDALKRRIGDFYSKSPAARGFVSPLYKEVRQSLVREIPEYAAMTKNYEKTVNFIKDIESNLMLRSEGMTGRITADNTLRRLLSTLKDDFEMRGELVKALGIESNKELSQQIAGYASRGLLPSGLAGSGLGLGGAISGIFSHHPAFATVVAAASPRLQGELLSLLGQIPKGTSKVVGKAIGYSAAEQERQKSQPSMPQGFTMQTPPDVSQHKGRIIENEKGQRFISDGTNWIPQ